ncbi:mlo-related protein [Artemisia annua]|uniref:MLO-like protein n=1 Tax=Artemisia annua TaxID=35608 RepID=A0A2U1L8D3_ARTAN|nr:mlo-related protein [Artemisia annua]
MGEYEGEGMSIEFTPTWVVAAVCSIFVGTSLAVERLLYFAGKKLKKEGRKPLFQALQKVKEELMLLGFISLLLSVCQGRIVMICVNEPTMEHFLPCSFKAKENLPTHRRLLEDKLSPVGYCAQKNKVPLLSPEALHHLHIFIFVLAIVHVTFTVLTIVIGGAKIRQWKKWETSIREDSSDTPKDTEPKFTFVRDHDFFMKRFMGFGKRSTFIGWLQSFFKQFYGSVTKTDYIALRLGFIKTHCRGNKKFNFHKYMIRVFEDDFKKVVGIRQVRNLHVLVLVDNCDHIFVAEYSWYAEHLLLSVGTKLEHIIIQLAHEVAEKHIAVEGEPVVKPSDDHFWFHRPRILLLFIHFILFQNAFELAYFSWILVQFGPNSCIVGKLRFIIPRLVIGFIIQVLCSYSTLPLYALVTQMGSKFKKSIFEEHVQVGIISWAHKAKSKMVKNLQSRHDDLGKDGGGDDPHEGDEGVELQGIHIARDPQQFDKSVKI